MIAAAILYAGSMILIEVVRGPATAVGIWFLNFIAERSCPNCGTVMPLDIYPKFIVIPLSAFGVALLAAGLLIGEWANQTLKVRSTSEPRKDTAESA